MTSHNWFMQRIQQASGLIIDRSIAEPNRFLGSCFSYKLPNIFLAAQHCIAAAATHDIWVGLPALGSARSGTLKIRKVHAHPSADLAVLVVETPSVATAYSISGVDWAAGWGERVVSFGYPNDTQGSEVLPTARMYHGNIQRFFDYTDARGTYRALEVSFPAPQGLSGSPISRTQDTGAAVGLVTANHQALSYRGGYEMAADGVTWRATERDVTMYGIAVYLPEFAGWIDEQIAGATECAPG